MDVQANIGVYGRTHGSLLRRTETAAVFWEHWGVQIPHISIEYIYIYIFFFWNS
jgi:hypothetical protein